MKEENPVLLVVQLYPVIVRKRLEKMGILDQMGYQELKVELACQEDMVKLDRVECVDPLVKMVLLVNQDMKDEWVFQVEKVLLELQQKCHRLKLLTVTMVDQAKEEKLAKMDIVVMMESTAKTERRVKKVNLGYQV